MEIVSFSVRNFRSITDAKKIDFKKYTVLIGKNNEGKSNVLKVLSCCMNLINQPREFKMIVKRNYKYFRKDFYYDWERDFPIIYQNRKKGLKTIFKLEFLLTEEELKEFKNITRTRITSRNIILQIEIDQNNEIEIKLPKKGTNSLTNRALEVLKYISSKITYNYIPARRQETDTIKMIGENISKEFQTMEENEEYKKALEIINKLQEEKLKNISIQVKPMLKEFIPNIRDVKIEFEPGYKYNRISDRDISIMIDDGVLTNIEYKGDGIRSLMALAILNNRTDDKTTSIICIDEPEAHLHPGAMNELAKTLRNLSVDNQIIISTHSQLFMDKENIKSNIIVNEGKAKPAKNVHEIRELLGIKMSDNLMNSEYILLVEGETDKIILTKIICTFSEKLKKYIMDGVFSIFSSGGASKIGYNLNIFNSQFCKCYVFVDDDVDGNNEIKKILDSGMIGVKNINVCKCKGMQQAEIEDCFKAEIYKEEIKEIYGINIDVPEFRSKLKWSERMKNVFNAQGQIWNEKIEKDIKTLIATKINEKFTKDMLIEQKSTSINAMITKIEENI